MFLNTSLELGARPRIQFQLPHLAAFAPHARDLPLFGGIRVHFRYGFVSAFVAPHVHQAPWPAVPWVLSTSQLRITIVDAAVGRQLEHGRWSSLRHVPACATIWYSRRQHLMETWVKGIPLTCRLSITTSPVFPNDHVRT